MNKIWIPEALIKDIFNAELIIIYFVILIMAYVFYKIFLKNISSKRHNNLMSRFKKFPLYFFILTVFLILGYLDEFWPDVIQFLLIKKIMSYCLLVGFVSSAIVLIKIFQILIYCYLFFANMRQGIPRLIANVFTFVFSLILFGLMGSYLFKINIAAIGATSAVFSIILGLALQDTIGNLFAGISLQIDQSIKIGDWLEIISDSETWIGQVQEITWRSTYLIGFSEDIYMIPNRVMASAKVVFQVQESKSKRLSHIFRFSYEEKFNKVKEVILNAVVQLPIICDEPRVRVLLLETQDSWIRVGVFYTIEDYSLRYRIGDQVIQKIVEALAEQKIQVQVPRIDGQLNSIR